MKLTLQKLQEKRWQHFWMRINFKLLKNLPIKFGKKALGQNVLTTLTEEVDVKIVKDELTELTEDAEET